MGSKYSTLSASGYNSSPPSDNGAQTATNLVKWSTHKTKLTDPIKALADAINTALVTAFDYSVRQITSNDSTVANDHMRCVEIAPSVTAAVTVSLGDAATMGTVYRTYIKNSSARNQTLSRATGGDTIDGTAGDVTIPPGGGVIVQTNATPNGYLIVARHGPLVDSDAVAVGSSDGTKKVRLEVDGVTAATTRVLTVPDYDGTIATLAGTEALTNKTLTSPTIQGTVAAGTGLTLPALTLGGALTGVIDSATGQIKFPASQNASADANTLDDYEEGTWTPTLKGATTTTYTTQVGRYTKIGRQVFIYCDLIINSLGDGSTTLITGLPFTANATGSPGNCVNYFAGIAISTTFLTAAVDNSSTDIRFADMASAGTTMNASSAIFASGARVRFSISYDV